MIKMIILLTLIIPSMLYATEVKKVCIDKTASNGKMVQECKAVKVHKKLEGTPVPPKK